MKKELVDLFIKRARAILLPIMEEFEVKKMVLLPDPSKSTEYAISIPEKEIELFKLATEYIEFVLKKKEDTAAKRKAARAIYKRFGEEIPFERRSKGLLKKRFSVLERDNFKCFYCGRGANEGAILHVDHINPKSHGGDDSIDNLVTACFECNIGKFDALLQKRKEIKTLILTRNKQCLSRKVNQEIQKGEELVQSAQKSL